MRALLTSLLLVTAVGCSYNQATTTPLEQPQTTSDMSNLLETSQWLLTTLNGNAVKTSSGKSLSLAFDGASNRISGFAGCNNYFATYSTDNSMLNFSHLGMTRKFCQDGMELESQFAKMMSQVKAYTLNENTLMLLGESKQVLASFVEDN
ncbi:META domain-containing protein [Colwellia sp. MEBiC06753]